MKLLAAPLRRPLLAASALALAALPAGATWSVVAVDTRTGEVAVASATCLENLDLSFNLPVVVVGKGAGASQSLLDTTAVARRFMYDGFQSGLSGPEIFVVIDDAINTRMRQFGIVPMEGDPFSFSGNQVGAARFQIAGQVDSIKYAVQGNVIVANAMGALVEQAFREAEGDLGQRVMAAMERARELGGDGRCSCDGPTPFSCGMPPAGGFEKSAHIGFLVLARIGDVDGICNANQGCVNGDYYLKLNVIGDANDPDPVLQLEQLYAEWRAGQAGHPDHLLSTVRPAAAALVADGVTSTSVTVQLADVDGTPIDHGGAAVTVGLLDDGPTPPPDVAIGPVQDLGDGSYRFEVTAGAATGTARFVVVADDGVAKATLYPYAELRLDPVVPLHANVETLDVGVGGDTPFVIHDDEAAHAAFLLVGSYSGTVPGVTVGPHHVPLNFDSLTLRSVERAGQGVFVGSAGRLDATGRGEARLHFAPGGLGPQWIGRRLDWAAVYFGGALGGSLRVAGPAGFDVVHP